MRTNRFYRDLTPHEAVDMEDTLYREIETLGINHPIRMLFQQALWDYKIGIWSYDGATFSMSYRSFWEIPSFIHDWRNSKGYVGKAYDDEMFAIMIYLNYPLRYIIQRRILTTLTFLNIFRHWLKGNLRKDKPDLIFKL